MRKPSAVGASFALGAAGGIGLIASGILKLSTQFLGVMLAIALTGIGVGLVVFAHQLRDGDATEERHEFQSEPPVETPVSDRARRSFLRGLTAALGALVIGLAGPLRSLGRDPTPALKSTSWESGLRLVNSDGHPIKAGEVTQGSVVTVFPEGHIGDAMAQALLIRVDPATLDPDRAGWAPDGHLVVSKVCTHAGCPVGLYEAQRNQLLCPCHQSTFDLTNGAKPVFGPAARPLPQLPVAIDDQGWLMATGDFPEPVGPGFWDRGR
ncbi:MAG: Rieske 2Fe-2S domain-containing protein [Acidimicrobiia bacterium]